MVVVVLARASAGRKLAIRVAPEARRAQIRFARCMHFGAPALRAPLSLSLSLARRQINERLELCVRVRVCACTRAYLLAFA